jgi:hypothetical protein
MHPYLQPFLSIPPMHEIVVLEIIAEHILNNHSTYLGFANFSELVF